MMRKACKWFLLLSAVSIGAPAQDGKPVLLKGWGQAVDPEGDCRIDLAEGKLAITVSAKQWHALDAEANKVNAPVVLRDIDGDFIVEVKVGGTFRPAGPSAYPRGVPFNGAGILLRVDTGNYLRLERAAILRDGRIGPYILFEERKNSRPVPPGDGITAPDAPMFLRLERRGDEFTATASPDGKSWRAFPSRTVKYPATVKIGVAASSSSSQDFNATFEGFRVWRLDLTNH